MDKAKRVDPATPGMDSEKAKNRGFKFNVVPDISPNR